MLSILATKNTGFFVCQSKVVKLYGRIEANFVIKFL
jgi:hypothetical protein